jgi:hypothetical protein
LQEMYIVPNVEVRAQRTERQRLALSAEGRELLCRRFRSDLACRCRCRCSAIDVVEGDRPMLPTVLIVMGARSSMMSSNFIFKLKRE